MSVYFRSSVILKTDRKLALYWKDTNIIKIKEVYMQNILNLGIGGINDPLKRIIIPPKVYKYPGWEAPSGFLRLRARLYFARVLT